MNQRVALALAAALTAFSLVIIGGIIALRAPAPAALAGAEPSATELSATVEPAAPTAEPALAAERESTYQNLVAMANARLEQANAELRKAHEREAQLQQALAEAQARPAEAPAQPAAPAPQPAAIAAPAPVPEPAVSAARAAAIARSIAPGATLARGAELVDYQGTTAYEVVLDRGTIYVDAGSGKVLYDGTTPALVTSARATGHDRGGHEAEGNDHEAEGHDDD